MIRIGYPTRTVSMEAGKVTTGRGAHTQVDYVFTQQILIEQLLGWVLCEACRVQW